MGVVGFESGDQGGLRNDGTAGDVGDEGVAFGQDCEFLFAEQVGGFLGQGDGNEEVVDVLGEEMVEVGFAGAAVPCVRDFPLGITGAGDDEAIVVLAFGSGAWTGGVGYYVHAQGFCYIADLTADTAVAEHAKTLAGFVVEVAEEALSAFVWLAPSVGFLPLVEERVVVGGDEHGHENPFCDLGAVYS